MHVQCSEGSFLSPRSYLQTKIDTFTKSLDPDEMPDEMARSKPSTVSKLFAILFYFLADFFFFFKNERVQIQRRKSALQKLGDARVKNLLFSLQVVLVLNVTTMKCLPPFKYSVDNSSGPL